MKNEAKMLSHPDESAKLEALIPAPSAIIAFVILLCNVCNSTEPFDDLSRTVMALRTAKDSLLRYDDSSPIPAMQRATFPGLAYFPIRPEYRIMGALHIYGRRRLVQVLNSGGSLTTMERFGRFLASWQGNSFSLEVHRSLDTGEILVMFTDDTSGQDTYTGGRFVALSTARNGTYVVDFNNAYFPYCAYEPTFVCPLPPELNHLSFSVRAGERTGGADLAH